MAIELKRQKNNFEKIIHGENFIRWKLLKLHEIIKIRFLSLSDSGLRRIFLDLLDDGL